MNYMFAYNPNLDFDLSKWNTSKVQDMSNTFRESPSLSTDLSRWDTSQVTSMEDMFAFVSDWNGDLSRWNTSRVLSLRGMLNSATSFNSDLSNWNSSQCEMMDYLFLFATAFNHSLCWDTSCVIDISVSAIFYGSQGNFSAYPSCLMINHHSTMPTIKPIPAKKGKASNKRPKSQKQSKGNKNSKGPKDITLSPFSKNKVFESKSIQTSDTITNYLSVIKTIERPESSFIVYQQYE